MDDAEILESQGSINPNEHGAESDRPEHGGAKKEHDPLSFYECPTAACSIVSLGGQQDNDAAFDAHRFKSFSLDSSEDDSTALQLEGSTDNSINSVDRSTNCSLSGEGGSVPCPTAQRARGGYFGGSAGALLQGAATLSERPRSLIANSPMHAEHLHQPAINVRSAMMTPTNAAAAHNELPTGQKPLTRQAAGETPGAGAPGSPLQSAPPSPVTTHAEPHANVSSTLNAVSPAVKDYSRAVECGNTSETSFVHEGYDTVGGAAPSHGYSMLQIKVPRYRPVEIVEKVVEVPVVHHVDTYVTKKEIQEVESIVRKPYTKYVDKIIEVPEVHYNDKIVEVPEYHEITKTVPKIEVQERIKYMPKVEVKVVPKYVEVPVVKIVDKYEEYEEVEEVIKHVEKIEIVEVPREVVKHVVKPVKKIIEQERIIPVVEHRDVPVEKIRFVPKIETVELVREIPKIIDVPVPYNVPKVEYVDQPYEVPEYRDVHVAVPVRKRVTPVYHYTGEPEVIDVPVHRPYFLIHDHISFKAASAPLAENIKVVGTRPVDLNSMTEAERQEANTRMLKAVSQRTTEPAAASAAVHHAEYHRPEVQQSTASPLKAPDVCSPKTSPTLGPAGWPRPVQLEIPMPGTIPFAEPTFRAPSTPPSNRRNTPFETIIYRNSPKGGSSPVSEAGATDVYPRSNVTTPRLAI